MDRSNALTVQSVAQVHLYYSTEIPPMLPPYVVLMRMLCSCNIRKVVFMFKSEVVLFMCISEVVYSQVVSGSSNSCD